MGKGGLACPEHMHLSETDIHVSGRQTTQG